MQEERKTIPTEEVQDVTGEEFTEQDVLLARLYDICVELGSMAEITSVETEDGKKMIVIILSNVIYSKDKGFEKL